MYKTIPTIIFIIFVFIKVAFDISTNSVLFHFACRKSSCIMIQVKNFVFKKPDWRPKVLVTSNDVPEAGVKILREKCDVTICETSDRDELLAKSKGMDGIFWASHNKLDAEALEAAGPQLKSLSTMSVGIDYVDLEEVKRRKIPLGYTPTVLNDAVADIAVGLAIAASRHFHQGRMKIESSEWEKRPQWLLGQEMRDSTVGIVGFGGIGQTIAKRLTGFDVGQFLYCGHNKKPAGDKIGAKFVSFDELIEKSDFIFIICPLTSETRNMFNAAVFDKMKPTSVLVNVARGDVVDQEALYDALKNNKIFAAGLDVMTPEPLPSDHPLMSLPNCVIIPHLGSATVRTRDDMAKVAAINVLAGLAEEPMHSPVY
jgi:glyoxylate/hydroxypyruvate reductase